MCYGDVVIMVVRVGKLENKNNYYEDYFDYDFDGNNMIKETIFTSIAMGLKQVIVCVNQMDKVGYDQ